MSETITTKKSVRVVNQNGPFGGVYFFTIVGAAAYFVHHSYGFWGMIMALVKAVVWPGIVTWHVLNVLHV